MSNSLREALAAVRLPRWELAAAAALGEPLVITAICGLCENGVELNVLFEEDDCG